MRLLITGASGFVGSEILRQLHGQGHQLKILCRSQVPQTDAEVVHGSVQDSESLLRACQGAEVVIHLVGIISESGQNQFEKVHAQGTDNLVQTAKRSGVKRFIQMSALGTRPNSRSRYHRSKWIAEESVRQSGMAYTIFRPSIIFGPGDQFLNLFEKLTRFSPVLPILGDGKNKMQPIAVDEVARAFVKSIDCKEAHDQTFDLCGPESLTFEELLDQLMQGLDRKRLKVHIPWQLAKGQALLLETLFKLLRRPPPLNRDQLLMLQEDNVGNPEPARNAFGLTLHPFAQAIAYLKNGGKR